MTSNTDDAKGAQNEPEREQAEIDKARAEIDIARARVEGARTIQEVIRSKPAIPADIIAKIDHEVAAAAAVVKELEADAQAKGIPITLSGNRYRIYIT